MFKRFITRLLFLFRGGEHEMPVIYATLIARGLKVYKDVPNVIKPDVAEVLRGLELDHLITE